MEPAAAATKEAQFLKALFEGRTGYALAASFETPMFLHLHELPLNQRIDIFAKRQ